MESIAWIAFLISHVLVTVLSALWAIYGPYRCVRDICIAKANITMKNMNSTVNPCVDFYSFACGMYENNSKEFDDAFSDIEFDVSKYTEQLFFNRLHTSDYLLLVIGKFFMKCAEVKSTGKKGEAEITRQTIFQMGVFPAILHWDKWKDDNFNIVHYEFISKLKGFTGQSVFSSYIDRDLREPEKMTVFFGPPIYPIIEAHNIIKISSDNDYLKLYKHFVLTIFDFILNIKLNSTTVSDLISLELQIVKAAEDSKTKNEKYLLINVNILEKKVPIIDWKAYLNYSVDLSPGTSTPKTVILANRSFFYYGLEDILKKTKLYTLALFMVYRNLVEVAPFIEFPDDDTLLNFLNEKLHSILENRILYCKNLTGKYFGGALTSLIIKTFSIKHGGQDVLKNIVENINGAMENLIYDTKWMDSATKNQAVLKLKHIKYSLSVSEHYFKMLSDSSFLVNYYFYYCLSTSFVKQYLCFNKMFNKKKFELFHRKITVFDENIKHYVPKIIYTQERNDFMVPTAILQFPVFDAHFPMSVNYAGIGSAIALELIKGFDFEGANYDKSGSKRNWWSNETLENFYKKQTECSKDKPLFKKKENSLFSDTNTQTNTDERYLQKIDGLKISYKAFLKYLASLTLQPQSLPGLDSYSANKIFFISYANRYCSHKSEFNPRALFTAREMINIVSKLKIFRDAFDCKNIIENKYESLSNKCSLW